jgi:hypothetical protein
MTCVLVTGGRGFTERAALYAALDEEKPTVIIHGGATGADRMAGEYAADRRIPCITEPANWAIEGVLAGLIRNIRMIERHKPDLVVAAPGGAGTEHCIKNALLRGVPVKRIRL